jgi:predicted O-linked N-acetylglucosamine transferase (SPINDLY family)
VRARLAGARTEAPLFDSRRFARDLEALYRRMWARHEAGLPPQHLAAG